MSALQKDLEDNPAKHSISECRGVVFQPVGTTDKSSWPRSIKPTVKSKPYNEAKKLFEAYDEVHLIRISYVREKEFHEIIKTLVDKEHIWSSENEQYGKGYYFWCGDYWIPGVRIRYQGSPAAIEAEPLDTGFPEIFISYDDIGKITKVIKSSYQRARLPVPRYVLRIEKEREKSRK